PVTERHEGTAERMPVDRAADLHQSPRTEECGGLGPDDIGPPTLLRTLPQGRRELLVDPDHAYCPPVSLSGRLACAAASTGRPAGRALLIAGRAMLRLPRIADKVKRSHLTG